MPSPRQGDLFRNDDDSEERETPTWYPDPDEVRAELHAILAQMRAAQSMPLGEARLGRIGFDEWLRRSQAAA
jgi:hypothetical protein